MCMYATSFLILVFHSSQKRDHNLHERRAITFLTLLFRWEHRVELHSFFFFFKKKNNVSYSSLQVARVVQKDEQFVKFLKIYDAAVSGTLDATDFHAGCDGKGPTLCIFRLGNGFVLQK